MAPHKAKHDIFLDETRTRVVPGGHADAKFLVARKGMEIPERVAAKHGIVDGAVPVTTTDAALPDMSTPRANVAPLARPRVK